MEVRMLTTAAGPDGVIHQRQKVTVSDEKGKALIEGGFAIELAAVAAPEKAVAPRQKTRGKK